MGRSVKARPPADARREDPSADEKQVERLGDEKPGDEKREPPSFRPSKQDPFYLRLRLDAQKARRSARRKVDNSRRRLRWATDADFRDRHRARRYGLSLQDYRAILERQGNACAICKMRAKPLCVDHCHATGKVRGFLCRNCNLGLGNYNDNPDLHRAGAAYLEAARQDDSLRDAPHQDQGGKGANAASGTLAGGGGGEIFRESPQKFMASRMSAASLRSDLPLNSTPWAEALTGGRAAAETAAHSHGSVPGTDKPAACHPACR
jgi:Recombination endonuclease VII